MARPTPTEVSLPEARRMALAAQGFGSGRPAKPNRGHLRRLLSRLGSLQIDAVNVLTRAHYLPLFSRLGPYDRERLDELTYQRGEAFEYITHAASVVDSLQHPMWRWRMEAYESDDWWIRSRAAIESRQPGYVDKILEEVSRHGPLSFKGLSDPARRDRPQTKYAESSLLWWSKRPSDGKHVLESLWRTGVLAVAGRTSGFERIFDLAERVLPASALGAPALSPEAAQRMLARQAVSALGVAWVKDVADYQRMKVAATRAHLRALAEDGEIIRVSVEGDGAEAYADPAVRSQPVESAALLGPFDSMLWERSRNERLFGFTHSFEIYVPEAKRRFGYYVLPFLLGEELVARVDLKADRARSTLLVQSAHLEPRREPKAVTGPLAAELRLMASWLGLEHLEVRPQGDLSAALRRAV